MRPGKRKSYRTISVFGKICHVVTCSKAVIFLHFWSYPTPGRYMQLHQNQTITSNLWHQIQQIWFFEIWWHNGAASRRAHWSYPYVELWTFHLKLFFVCEEMYTLSSIIIIPAYILSKIDASTASSEMRKNCSIKQSSKCIHLSNKNEGVSGGCPRVSLSN